MGKRIPDAEDLLPEPTKPSDTLDVTVTDDDFPVISLGRAMPQRSQATRPSPRPAPRDRYAPEPPLALGPVSASSASMTSKEPTHVIVREAEAADLFLCRQSVTNELRWVTGRSIDTLGLAKAFNLSPRING